MRPFHAGGVGAAGLDAAAPKEPEAAALARWKRSTPRSPTGSVREPQDLSLPTFRSRDARQFHLDSAMAGVLEKVGDHVVDIGIDELGVVPVNHQL